MTATVHPIDAGREPSLNPLLALVANDMNGVNAVILDRMQSKVLRAEAVSKVKTEMTNENIEDKFAALEKQDEIEKLLNEIKSRRAG